MLVLLQAQGIYLMKTWRCPHSFTAIGIDENNKSNLT